MALCSNKMRYFNVASLVLLINIFILHTLVFTLMHIPYVDGFCFNKYDRFASLNIIQRQNYMKTRLRKTYSDEENPLSSTTMKIYQSRNNDDSESSENTVFNSETQSLKSERFATYSSQLNKLSEFTASREGRNVEKEVGGYDPSERVGGKTINVGDPQIRLQEKEFSVSSILKELAAIQQQGPQKYCILGTRHCSYLHQQIIELLAYALVLSGNHVFTSGAGGTNAATVRGALRAERPELLTVVLPQSMSKQPQESQKLLKDVEDVISMPQNDNLSLDVASRICNSFLLSKTDQLISFAFHESTTVIEATNEAKKLDMLVTVLYLD